MDLSIVVPCFNEEQGLPRLHEALRAVLPGLAEHYEIILVDDGSDDGTLEQARQLCRRDSCVHYVALSRNFGKEAALVAGLRRARGDRVAVLDADLQHPPELLTRMRDLLDAGYDQAVARRDRRGDPKSRAWLSRAYYWVVGRFVDVPLRDGVGDFRMLSRRAVDAVLALPENNRFSKGLFSWIGFPTATVSYANVPRSCGSSGWSVGKLVNYGLDGLLSFNTRPLRAAVYAGIVVTVLSFGYAAFVLGDALINGVRVPGYTTLLTGVIGFGGVQLLLLGIVGEYLGRIYAETKRRPLYVVRDSDAQLGTRFGENGRALTARAS